MSSSIKKALADERSVKSVHIIFNFTHPVKKDERCNRSCGKGPGKEEGTN